MKRVKNKIGGVLLPFPAPQIKAVFLNRPQRFLAKVRTSKAGVVLAYCANPGSLKGCLKPGSAAVLWDSRDIKRRRRYTWRAVKVDNVWVGTDTHLTNRLVELSLRQGLLSELAGYDLLKKEPRGTANNRVDFLLSGPQGKCFIEVKSAVVVRNGIAQFPDSITPRSIEQLKFLTRKAKQGHRAALIFAVQRGDAEGFSVNTLFYPEYDKAFKLAAKAGVEFFAWGFAVSTKGFGMPFPLKIIN